MAETPTREKVEERCPAPFFHPQLLKVDNARIGSLGICGASHIRTYWVPEYVDLAVAKLDGFFAEHLK